MKKKILSIVLATSLMAGLIGCGSSTGASTSSDSNSKSSAKVESIDTGIELTSKDVTVTLGEQGYYLTPIIEELGWFESAFADNNIKVDIAMFNSGPEEIESFTAGKLDIGLMGMQPVIAGASNDVGVTVLSTFYDGPRQTVIATLEDSDIKTVKDLKGKKVAAYLGSSEHSLLVWALKQNGLKQDDIEIVNADFSAAGTILESGEVDASVGYTSRLSETAELDGVKFNYILDASGSGTAYQVIVADTEFAKEHADIVETILVLYDKAIEYIENNEDDAVKLLSEHYGVKEDLIRAEIGNEDYGFAEDAELTQAFDDYIGFMKDNDLLTNDVSADDLIDFQYINATDIEKGIKISGN